MASKKFRNEFPFPVRELADRYKVLEKLPFRLELGGKVLELVVGDGTDIYLIYDLQQQVLYGAQEMDQAAIAARVNAVLIELWPTSILAIEDHEEFKQKIFKGLLEWAIEFGNLSDEQANKATQLRDSLG